MILEPFERGLGDFSVITDIRTGRLHIVCVAVNALTFFNAIAVGRHLFLPDDASDGLTHEQADAMVTQVNEQNEVGTLWPALSITIIPLSIYGERNDMCNRKAMNRHVDDAFEANEKHGRASTLLFALENRGDFAQALAYEILREKLNRCSDLSHTRRVAYIP